MAKQESTKSVSAEVILVDPPAEDLTKNDEKHIPEKYVLEFISRHHIKPLWDEFIFEKNHPKIPLSAKEVLEMINLSPEEQDRIIKEHE
jgi:hypothetical protein